MIEQTVSNGRHRLGHCYSQSASPIEIRPCQLSIRPVPIHNSEALTFRTKSSMSGIQASSGVLIIPDSSGLSEYGSSIAAPQDPRAPSLRDQMVSSSFSITTRASRETTYAKSLTLLTFSIPSRDLGQLVVGLKTSDRQSTYRQHYRSSARCPHNTCPYQGTSAARKHASGNWRRGI